MSDQPSLLFENAEQNVEATRLPKCLLCNRGFPKLKYGNKRLKYSNFPDPENGLKPCPVLLAPSVLPPKYPSTCHRHSGKGLFDVSGHVFNELADKCLNLLVRYMENSVDALKHRTHNDL